MILSKKSFFALFIALSCFFFMNSQAGVAVSGDEDVVAGVLGAKIDIYLSRVTRSGLAGEVPKIKELIDLRWPVEVALSPDGNAVAFGVEVANWEKNRYDREIWVSREGREPVAFVKDQSSNYGLKWSPDGLTLFFLSDRTGKPQVYSVSLDGGEAQALTNVEQGVNSFDVSPAADRLALAIQDPEDADMYWYEGQYHGSTTPWNDPEVFKRSAPISYVEGAKTPTLIQHGEKDRVGVTANSFELFRGLKDNHVPVRFVLYKGFGHSINKPKGNLAVMTHNEDWFVKWIWDGRDPLKRD